MLPSSGYTRLNTVRSSLNLAYVIDGTLALVQHEIARYGVRVVRKKRGGSVIHVKLKSWLRHVGPTVPYLNINLISCFLRYSWLARPAFNTATFMSSSVWFGWLKWAGTGRSFLPLMISLRCSRKRSANLRPVSPMYTIDGHLVHDKQ